MKVMSWTEGTFSGFGTQFGFKMGMAWHLFGFPFALFGSQFGFGFGRGLGVKRNLSIRHFPYISWRCKFKDDRRQPLVC